MKRMITLAALLVLGGCAGGPGLQIGAQHPKFIAKGRPGLHIATAALESGLPETALAITSRLLEKNPRDLGALVAQGDALAALGHNDAAAECYRRALGVDGQSSEALLALGRIRLAAGQPDEAEALFRRLVSAAPSDARAQNNLGIALDMLGRHADAQAAYRAALQAAPDMSAARTNLGLSYAMSGAGNGAPALLLPPAPDAQADRASPHSLTPMRLPGDDATATAMLDADPAPPTVQASR